MESFSNGFLGLIFDELDVHISRLDTLRPCVSSLLFLLPVQMMGMEGNRKRDFN